MSKFCLGDEIMKTIVNGGVSRVVETVGKQIGAEEAAKFHKKNTDAELIATVRIIIISHYLYGSVLVSDSRSETLKNGERIKIRGSEY